MRESITLVCGDCKRKNYITSKNKTTNKERKELIKFCSHCKKHTKHKEEK